MTSLSDWKKLIELEEKKLVKFFDEYKLPHLTSANVMLDENWAGDPLNKELADKIKDRLLEMIKEIIK